MPGRKNKPTNIKKLEDNPGRRPLNELEPEPEIVIPPCPPHLSDLAKIEWVRITKELEAVGIISLLDMANIASYCQMYDRWIRLELDIQKNDMYLKTEHYGKKGNLTYTSREMNPSVTEARLTLQQLRQFATELGLSPAARPKLQTGIKKKTKDPMENILGFTG